MIFFLISNICLNQLSFKLKHTNHFLNLIIFLFENDLFLFVYSSLNPILWPKIIQGYVRYVIGHGIGLIWFRMFDIFYRTFFHTSITILLRFLIFVLHYFIFQCIFSQDWILISYSKLSIKKLLKRILILYWLCIEIFSDMRSYIITRLYLLQTI